MAFKMNYSPNKKTGEGFPFATDNGEKKFMKTVKPAEKVKKLQMTKDKNLIPATERPKEFDVIKKRETYEYNPQTTT